jgi:hypothetical protein
LTSSFFSLRGYCEFVQVCATVFSEWMTRVVLPSSRPFCNVIALMQVILELLPQLTTLPNQQAHYTTLHHTNNTSIQTLHPKQNKRAHRCHSPFLTLVHVDARFHDLEQECVRLRREQKQTNTQVSASGFEKHETFFMSHPFSVECLCE